MAIYAQHGYGKSDKLTRGLSFGVIDGTILSPRDESPSNLETCVRTLRGDFPSADVLIDPQFYASTLTSHRLGHLPEYGYFQSDLTRRSFISPRNISTYVSESLTFQRNLAPSRLISPNILIESFDNPWSQVALQMAQEADRFCSEEADLPPVLISLVISEGALSSTRSLGEFLDIISTLGATGFYLIVCRASPTYTPQMELGPLENLLYMIYVLGVVNDYEIVVGYADIPGLLLQAVGARATACGWHNGLRHFTLARFQPPSVARRARARYTSIPLLNSMLVTPELESAREVGMLDDVMTSTEFDRALRANPASPWPLDVATLHHWASLRQAATAIKAHRRISERLEDLLRRVGRARTTYADLRSRGVSFEEASGPNHLEQWQRAILSFRATANV